MTVQNKESKGRREIFSLFHYTSACDNFVFWGTNSFRAEKVGSGQNSGKPRNPWFWAFCESLMFLLVSNLQKVMYARLVWTARISGTSIGFKNYASDSRKRLCSCVRRDDFGSAVKTRFAQTLIRAAIFSSQQLQVFARNHSKFFPPMEAPEISVVSLSCIHEINSCKLDT